MVLPSHSIDYNWHFRQTNDAVSYGGNIAWAKTGESIKGIGYTFDVENRIDNTVSHNLIIRKIGTEETSFSVKYEDNMEVFKKYLVFNMDHPTDFEKQAYFEV